MSEVNQISGETGQWLLRLARRTLESLEPAGSRIPSEPVLIDGPVPPEALDPRGVFVTLRRWTALRGCIGYVLPVEPLFRAVIENTVSAARRDPRFPPVEPDETSLLHVEISILTIPRPVSDIREIVVGRDGLIVSKGVARGLLLPQVPHEHGWDLDTFLEHTCLKAGLPRDSWKQPDCRIEFFSAQIFSEPAMA